jgi:hypothetical protein
MAYELGHLRRPSSKAIRLSSRPPHITIWNKTVTSRHHSFSKTWHTATFLMSSSYDHLQLISKEYELIELVKLLALAILAKAERSISDAVPMTRPQQRKPTEPVASRWNYLVLFLFFFLAAAASAAASLSALFAKERLAMHEVVTSHCDDLLVFLLEFFRFRFSRIMSFASNNAFFATASA